MENAKVEERQRKEKEDAKVRDREASERQRRD